MWQLLTLIKNERKCSCLYHVPGVVSEPVDDTVEATDTLKVLSLDGALIHEEHNEAGRHERHRTDDEDRDEYVRAGQSVNTRVLSQPTCWH